MLSIWTNISEFAIDVKDFFVENSRNPFLWVGIILVALIVFEFTYNKLKTKE